MKNLSNQEELELLKRSLDALPRGILITDCQQEDDPIICCVKEENEGCI